MGLLDSISRHAHWALRIALAATFLFHGLSKFPGISAFAEGIGLPVAVAFLVPVAEVGGALLILLGGVLGECWAIWQRGSELWDSSRC